MKATPRPVDALYAGLGLVAGRVAARDDLPGRPFGIDLRLSTRAAVTLGAGSAISAPWPMLVGLMVRPTTRRRTMLATLFMVGCLAEPITWQALAGRTARPIRAITAANLILPLLMLTQGAQRASTTVRQIRP